MPSRVVLEGNTDYAIVHALDQSLNAPKPEEATFGRDAAMERAAIVVAKGTSRRVALVLDRNGHTPAQLEAELTKFLSGFWGALPERKGAWYIKGESALRLVMAGLPNDPTLKDMGIVRYASDDYLLRLCLMDESLASFCAKEANLAYVPPFSQHVRMALDGIASLLQKNGSTINSAKRYLCFVIALLGFPASRAQFAQHLIERASADLRDQVLGTFLRDIQTDPPL
jgi:hypothetical protein